jgi:hypothetical protein
MLAAMVLVALSGCGDSGSRGASGVTGSTSVGEGAVSADKKGKDSVGGVTRGRDDEGTDDKEQGGGQGQGNGGPNANQGGARGRPQGEVQGAVAGRTPGCPAFTFQVAGVGIRANGVTEFEGTTCATLQNGDLVKVEGQPLGDGTILAREVKKLDGAVPANLQDAAGVTVRLVDSAGAVAAAGVTNGEGKFEFRNTAPGVYRLTAQLPGSPTSCPTPLASGVQLVAQRNRVRGTLDFNGSPTCANLVLTKGEARNGS